MPVCIRCKGRRIDSDLLPCSKCAGTGFVPDPQIEVLVGTLRDIGNRLRQLVDMIWETRGK